MMNKPTLKTYRRSCQIFVAVSFIIIPILNRTDYSYVYGNYLSFHLFGIPFADPLAVLQLTIKNLYLTLDNVVGTLLPLLLAFFLGTVFCSWLCAYGLFSEWTQRLSRKLMPRGFAGLPLHRKGFPFKLTVFLLGFVGFFVFSTTPILNQLSTPAWYARFFQYLFGQDILSLCFLFLLALLVVEFIAQKRLWCRYVCPQSVLIILAKQLNRKRMKVVFDKDKCICKPGYERCDAACSLHLQPKTVHRRIETECSNCGDCVVACKKMGRALSFEFALGRELLEKTRFGEAVPALKKAALGLVGLALLTGVGFAVFQALQDVDFFGGKPSVESILLANKKISWNDDRADYYELLDDGTLVCVGGDWPTEGFKGWQWQPEDKLGSFKIIEDDAQPGTYSVVRLKSEISPSGSLVVEQYVDGVRVDEGERQYTIAVYEPLLSPHGTTATEMDARVVLYRYAGETYILDLSVRDPGGKRIKKILTAGDLITTEGMLTAVHRWINSPVITASKGTPPPLPVHTSMEIRFHDGRVKKIGFVTNSVIDRSSEEFEDMWF